jgi:protein SCO1/2
MKRALFLLSLATSLLCAAALVALPRLQPLPQPAIPQYGRLPEFALLNQRGEPVTRDTLAGRVWVADFIFTRCAGQCPMMTAIMVRLAAQLHDAPAVQLVSITVDPTWDTPEVLARYAHAHAAIADRWLWLTGSREAITRLCVDGFKLSVDDASGTPQEPITHSTRLVLVDAHGVIRGYYDTADAAALQRLPHDARRLAGT